MGCSKTTLSEKVVNETSMPILIELRSKVVTLEPGEFYYVDGAYRVFQPIDDSFEFDVTELGTFVRRPSCVTHDDTEDFSKNW